MRTRFAIFRALLAVLLLGAGLSIAQGIYATLIGTVTDSTGAVVPNATVTVHSNDTNADVRTITTDGRGNFTATNLAAGNYTVTVKSPGFRTLTAGNVVLQVAQKRPLDVQLQPDQVTENVTVSETATPIQTTSAAQAGTITGAQIRELQLNNRNFDQLVTPQTGVVSGLPDVVNFGITNTSTVVVNGARASANNWTVDGADIQR
jgi:hypothetical protein